MSARHLNEAVADAVIPGTGVKEARVQAWRWAGAAIALTAMSIFAIFWQTASSIENTWATTATFSHGYLITPISGFLIWNQRTRLATLWPQPSAWGLGAAAVAALVWLIGDIAGAQVVQQFALVALLQSLVVAVIGIRAAAVIAVPLLYLFFNVPFGKFLIPPLQDLTAAFIVRILQYMGMPVYLDGIFIYIPSGSFEVAKACSGVRFLIATVALGVVFAYEFYRQLWRRALFMAMAVIVPIIANGFRATGIVLLAHYTDYDVAVIADHIIYGLIFLSIILFLLLAIGYSFREPYREFVAAELPADSQGNRAATRPFGLLRFPAAAAAVFLIATAGWAYATQIGGAGQASQVALTLPASSSWRAVTAAQVDWKPTFPNVSQEIMQRYSNGTQQVDVYLAYFARQRQGAEVVGWRNDLAGPDPWKRADGGSMEVRVPGQAISANYERFLARGRQRTVWYWYWVDGRLTASPLLAKFLEAKAKLFGGAQGAAVIALAADSTEDPKAAQAALSDFLAQAWPLTQMIVTQ